MPAMTGEQLGALNSIDDKTKWEVAEAYRSKVRAGVQEFPALVSAQFALIRVRPDLSDDEVKAAVSAILFWIAKEHNDWLWRE